MQLTVIIPVYNEEETLEEIIRRVKETGLANEILCVDDGSTDRSREILKGYENDPIVNVIFRRKTKEKAPRFEKGSSPPVPNTRLSRTLISNITPPATRR